MPKKSKNKKVVTPEDSEEEVSNKSSDSDVEKVEDDEEEERSEEEGEDEEEEDNESEKEQDSENEEDEESGEGDEDKEEESDDENKSEKSDNSERSGSVSSKIKSGSDQEENSEADDSEGSLKIKQKKKLDKEKKSKKEKKNNKKEDKDKNDSSQEQHPAIVSKLAESTQKPFTIASVSEDLDELSNYLSKTFRSFQTAPSDRQAMVSSSFRKDQVEDYRNEVNIKTADEREQNIQSENTYNPLRSYGKMNSLPIYEPGQGFRDAKPFKSEIGIQSEPQEIERKQASPEAKRAVEDYKRRKELEKRGYKDEPVESIRNFKENPSPYKKDAHNHFDNNSKHLEEYRSLKKGEEEDYHVELKRRTYSPNRSGGYGSRSNQIAENYYSNVNKKLVKEPSPTKKTLHDLYRHKPKSRFMEDESQPINKLSDSGYKGYYASEKHDQRFRQSNQSQKNQSVLDANRRQINDALDILVKKSRQNTNY